MEDKAVPTQETGKNGTQGYTNPPDLTSRREGGQDATAERISADFNADEKVIHNNAPATPPATTTKGQPPL